ncbi:MULTISPECIES: UDP-N-acetylmuramoyl-L-alanyl-D-glutamate--2,6-diaminopimelate ligase [Halomonadaceae]|uniref:UDP-N-acetylmuramoyl-L-alanyl-D-glutamate--2, 6-diaminopimelate ligase n=1 Tax=Halomonadaceae TaxID=28256 RepID=UPI001599EEAE|nr:MULTISPECIES: UDP-N-acetylmuramoyl-L-alanyl-D-glutamate--2,6-diaminopimelate ligase [Halomonas]QJQ97193.1 UDP-N-acetylmuramoyl-L-alanyl-D-glutamate--2,6-diaminopimelate ligase [Halomonas sp. PA5]
MRVSRQHLIDSLARRWPDAVAELAQLAPKRLQERVRLTLDSRDVTQGDVFIALPGVAVDGRDYIDGALGGGAGLVLCHADPGAESSGGGAERLAVLALPGLREQLGDLARELFGVPDDLELIGVTGTNGKSSVTHYIAALSEALGTPCGLVGTLGVGRLGAGELVDIGQTTPGAMALQAQLAALSGQGVKRVAMEVSSHALEQHRLDGCRMHAAVFTNLSRDHLDYHPSMAAYAAAKARLFKRDELALAVVNADDALARLMLAGLTKGVRVLACGEQEATTLRVVEWQPHAAGQRALIATPQGERVFELTLMGRFNLDNVLLAIATLYGLGEGLDTLFDAAMHLAAVPGRMQLIKRPGMPSVVIDYAHTPDALSNAITALKSHLGETGTLWCVVGCGGDRDRGKRPLMAAAAEAGAGRVVITDDNPRSEEAAEIRRQMLAGLARPTDERVWNVAGRAEAIARTIAAAEPGDIVLIAGKGHESYQEIAGIKHPFSDVAEAEAALALRALHAKGASS